MSRILILAALLFGITAAEAEPVRGESLHGELMYKRFLIRQVRKVWGSGQDVSLFAAQIRQESNWNHKARSPYAAGLTQFTRPTAEWIASIYPELGFEKTSGIGDPRYDWHWAIKAMVRYDAWLFKRLKRKQVDERQVWRLTLRSYNGGLGWIFKEIKGCEQQDMECCLRFRAASSCRENIRYPNQILNRWRAAYAGWNR